ncbi:hypothetical protein, partial [Burkholderia sp. Ac-20344]|uniref:hypothetical protein n=1 Tax=Burkholderia sp. Ac-20344 TaxID=2703890 RepID=UPI00197C750C
SASRRIVTICSSVNRLFFMTSFSPLEAILSTFRWSENSRAGQPRIGVQTEDALLMFTES